MSDKWEEVLDERDALEADLATARRELDEARAERDRAADYLRQIAASDSDATGMRALARAGLASLLSAKPSPESSPEATCGHADEGWEAFPCTLPKGHEGGHECRATMTPLRSPEAKPHRCGPECQGEDHASFRPPHGEGG